MWQIEADIKTDTSDRFSSSGSDDLPDLKIFIPGIFREPSPPAYSARSDPPAQSWEAPCFPVISSESPEKNPGDSIGEFARIGGDLHWK